MIRLICSECQRPLQVEPDLAGRRMYCPRCGHINAVPPAEPASADLATRPQEQATLAPAPSSIAVATRQPRAPADVVATLPPAPAAPETATLPPLAAFTDAPPASLPPGSQDPANTGLEAAAVGSSPDGYEILAELGRGGMGVVYKARQTRLRRTVALKMILGGGHAGAADLERFRTEAEAIARLQHPHIVQIYEVGEHDGLPYFSLEFCAGGSLEKKLAGTPLPARAVAALVEQLAHAMQAAHDKGVIHRDLKPANVLLAEDGTPKITDFGLAKKLDEAGQTQSGAIMGTPSYMAPEQAGGNSKSIGPAVDVYALGALLYELLTGQPPFKADTPMDTLLLVLEREPVPVRQLNPKATRDLETICLKCLEKEPRRRYASAGALADELRRFLDGEPIKARPPGLLQRANRWVRDHQALVLAYVLAGVAVAVHARLSGLTRQVMFGMPSVSAGGFHYAVLPLVVLVLTVFLRADRRAIALGTLPVTLAAAGWWYFVLGGSAEGTGGVWLSQVLPGLALLGTLLAAAIWNWRGVLAVQVPALALFAAAGWYWDGSLQPLLTGALHGLLLGSVARLVAWCLDREKAAAALGTLLGAYGGLVVAELYLYWGSVFNMLLNAASSFWIRAVCSLYAEVGVAYLGAIVVALLSRRPGGRRRHLPEPAP
jgi:tRNA A-37 threonylcarbamoyl transferase component Bud32